LIFNAYTDFQQIHNWQIFLWLSVLIELHIAVVSYLGYTLLCSNEYCTFCLEHHIWPLLLSAVEFLAWLSFSNFCFVRLLSFNLFQLAISFWSIWLQSWYLECFCCGPASLTAYTILVLLLWFSASFFDHSCSNFEIVKWLKLLQLFVLYVDDWFKSAAYWSLFCTGRVFLYLSLCVSFKLFFELDPCSLSCAFVH